MLKDEDIAPGATNLASILFAMEQKSTCCFFVDCWRLGTTTERDSYTIPKIDECTDVLGESTVYTHLKPAAGLTGEYWRQWQGKIRLLVAPRHVLIHPNADWIKNEQGTLRQPINVVLFPVSWYLLLGYTDKMSTISKTPEKHFTRIK